jgi:sugar lactone lactonase YvrE
MEIRFMNAKAMHTRETRPPAIRLQSVAKLLLGALILLGFLKPCPVRAQDVTTLIGGTINIFAGSTDPNAPQTYDGVQANTSQIVQPYFLVLDADGNLYFSYTGGVSVVYAGNKVPPILQLRVPSPQKGYQYMIAGSLAGPGSAPPCPPPDPCGDGGPALVPTGTTNPLIQPFGLGVDAVGNLYIADEVEQSIRKVSAADATISTIAGDPMHLQNGYSGDGGPATAALLSYPNAVRFDSAGNMYIADGGNYLIRRVDTSGNITTIAGNVSAAAAANGSGSFPPSCSASSDNCGEGGDPLSATLGFVFGMSFDPNGNLFLAESDIHVIREINLSASSPKIHTVAGTLRTPCDPSAVAQCGDNGAATSAFLNGAVDVLADASGNAVISDTTDNAVRLVSASDGKIQTIAGQVSATGGYGGDNGLATAAQLNAPNGLALDTTGNLYIADQINNLIRQVSPPKGLPPYTITFPAISPATYGTSPISLGATVNQTGQPVASYKVVSGPGRISGSALTVTGAGSITVEADQPGDSNYSAATPVTQVVTISPATLTVTADSLSRLFGLDNPPLTYTIAGLVNGDTTSVITGTPVLSTTATKSSPLGSYPITVAKGTLSAANYTFTLVNGILNVTQGQTQTINFAPIPNVTYGANAMTLHAAASSSLSVTFSASGPAQIQGSTLVVTGAGTVVVTATQPGDATYAPATPVTQSFTVDPAPLMITPVNVSRTYGTPNPAFSYTVSGFVGGDTKAVLSGAPIFATAATPASDVGSYPITITQGNLFSTNYTFTFGNGTLTITQAAQAITFGDVKDTAYTQSETLAATASSGLPVQYTATGAVKLHPAADGSSVTVSPTDLGPVMITATQTGNQNYSPAPAATVTFNVVKAEATVLVQNASRAFGASNPTFQYQIKLFPGDQAPDPVAPPYFTGTPDISTTATESSPPGTYDIVATPGTLTAEHYYFTFTDGTITVTSASSYIITTTPTSLTVPRGSTRQLTVTLSPVNYYAGSVTLGCGGLPSGVTCSFSPASLNIPPPDPGSSSAQPVQGTLTISANGSTSSAGPLDMSRSSRPLAAEFLLLPAGLGGLLLLVGRRRFLKSVCAQNGLVLTVLFGLVGLLAACSGGAKPNQVAAGTSVIQVTGVGTPSAGASDLNQSVSLSLTVQ